MSKILTACLMMAAQTYSIPPAVMVGIYNVEGGKVGQQVYNTNGTYDLGPMQINTLWLPKLANHWGVSEVTAKKWVRDDVCTNMGVSAWILRQHLEETGSLAQAIAHYHSRTPDRGQNYRRKVVAAMQKRGLIQASAPVYRAPASPQILVRATQNDRFGIQATRVSQTGTVGFGQKYSRYEDRRDQTRYAVRGMNTIVVYDPLNRE